jgi:hypothetical protein
VNIVDLDKALRAKRVELGLLRDDLQTLKYALNELDDCAERAEDALIDCIHALSELV